MEFERVSRTLHAARMMCDATRRGDPLGTFRRLILRRVMTVGRFSGGLLCLAVLSGCASHVSLSVPPASAPLSTRAEAYRALHSTLAVQTTTSVSGGGVSFDNEMLLGDGRTVAYAEDILPVVPEQSQSADYARRSLNKRSTGHTCGWISAVSAIAFAAIVVGVASSTGSGTNGLEKSGLAVSGLSAAGFGIANYIFLSSSSNDAMEAYRHYNDGLQQKLSICVGPKCGSSVIRDSSGSGSEAPKQK
jgi:hypothetical protein